jgi:2-dehydropantoate 2-reductase
LWLPLPIAYFSFYFPFFYENIHNPRLQNINATGVDLPEDFAAELDRSIAAFPPTMKTSMANDLEAGRPLELDWLAGKVVALGRGCLERDIAG